MSPPKCLLMLGNSGPRKREGQYLEVRISRTRAREKVKSVKCLSLQAWGAEFHLSTHRKQTNKKMDMEVDRQICEAC